MIVKAIWILLYFMFDYQCKFPYRFALCQSNHHAAWGSLVFYFLSHLTVVYGCILVKVNLSDVDNHSFYFCVIHCLYDAGTFQTWFFSISIINACCLSTFNHCSTKQIEPAFTSAYICISHFSFIFYMIYVIFY